MFKDRLDDAWFDQHPQYAEWLINLQKGLIIPIRPVTSIHHADSVSECFSRSPVLVLQFVNR
ncbi:hypothetical protein SynBIOSE41_02789 [Synechococcus sp. BIOS-E4-1]|nr:hypothetical protein SynBIOSE41_02789 [Synechococcus sp. BIOS-E4-1]